MPKRKYNASQNDIAKTRKAVKKYNELIEYARKYKGVSSAMLPEKASADAILRAFGDNPKKLNARLKELGRFTTKGKVFKTDSGVSTTENLMKYKLKQAKKSERFEVDRLARAKNLDPDVQDYRQRRVERLQKLTKDSDIKEIMRANRAILDPEYQVLQKKTAVTNFKLALVSAYADSEEELNTLSPKFNEQMNRWLNQLTEDEIEDMLDTDPIVRQIMEHYREKGDENLEVYGYDYFDLLTDLMQELPSKVRHYKRLRIK